ncbi:hypothetical protein CRYPA_108 [uncultured Candidatus Thioglobus sp.]|nr:hypothetical protein CRYPA_108 [uncultured Candidatus Thioglobus sp.]
MNLNYQHHHINVENNLVKSSIFEYFDKEKGVRICNAFEIKNIINEVGGLYDYKAYIKQASISFADNKGSIINFK